MIYGDDQCVNCGEARVEGSNLCQGCLLKLGAVYRNLLTKMVADNDELAKKLKICDKRLDGAVHYGFAKNRENIRLHKHLLQRAQIIEKGGDDAKNRESADREI